MILEVDPKVDYAFKHTFGRESARPILIDLIDKVRNPPPGHHIQEIELLNPFNPKEALDDKLSILDIKARDQSGRQFNVEMQMCAQLSYPKRVVYYGTKLHQQQLHAGEDYTELMPTISISFLNFTLFPEVPDYHLRFRLLEETHHFPLTDDQEYHILELPKFIKTVEELSDGPDIWLYFLKYAEKMDTEALPAAMRHPLVLRAVEGLTMLTQSDFERERYEARRKAQLDFNTGMKEAWLKGRDEGRDEGLKVGLINNIQFCERLLKRPVTPTQHLQTLSLDQLTRLAETFQETVQQQAFAVK